MAIFTGTATSFNTTNEKLHNETVLLLSDDIQCHLYIQANAPVIGNEELSDTTPMSGGGYAGAVSLTGKAIQLISGKAWKLDASPIIFTAGAGGIIDAYWWALFNNTPPLNKWLVGFGQLDNTNNPVSAAQGDNITINPHATDGFIRFNTST